MKEISGLGPKSRQRLGQILRQAKGTISVAEASDILQMSRAQTARLLARWQQQGWLSRVRRGLYVPVPLESPSAEVAFILPRNTAAGEVYQNFTTDFLTELAQSPAAHYWVVDNETTLADDLTEAAAEHNVTRVVRWKASKHTGADPKEILPYYLEKYGHYDQSESFEYFDIDTYVLEVPAPNFSAAEDLRSSEVDFGGQLKLTGYALGDAGDTAHLTEPQAASNNLLWLRLAWQKTGEHPENLKVSALIYTPDGQLVTQIDKILVSNILQVGSTGWDLGATVTIPATVSGNSYAGLLEQGYKPNTAVGKMQASGITPASPVPADAPAALIELVNTQGPEYWLALNNFYVITRYNHSPLYAMAVYQLSEEIRTTREQRQQALND